MHCTKISPGFECQRSGLPGTKNLLSAAETPLARTNGMRLLQCNSSGRAHFMATRGVFGGLHALYVW